MPNVVAGTTDDAFRIDLGGAFDTLNTPMAPPVLLPAAYLRNASSGRFSEAHRPGRGGMRRRRRSGVPCLIG